MRRSRVRQSMREHVRQFDSYYPAGKFRRRINVMFDAYAGRLRFEQDHGLYVQQWILQVRQQLYS